jgi:hypothetical protein
MISILIRFSPFYFTQRDEHKIDTTCIYFEHFINQFNLFNICASLYFQQQ